MRRRRGGGGGEEEEERRRREGESTEPQHKRSDNHAFIQGEFRHAGPTSSSISLVSKFSSLRQAGTTSSSPQEHTYLKEHRYKSEHRYTKEDRYTKERG